MAHKVNRNGGNESLLRLKRARGHLNKVIEMVEEGKSCGEVLQQLSAVISALGSTRTHVLKAHLNSCLKPVLKGSQQNLIREVEDVIGRAMKI